MSHAEIEISLERAKLARERSMLEEIEARQPTPPVAPPVEGQVTVAPKKFACGRWLARLGLKETAEDDVGSDGK